MAKKRVSGIDLEWIFRQRLADRDSRLRGIPLAIIPVARGWRAVVPARYRNVEKHIRRVEQQLQASYNLAE